MARPCFFIQPALILLALSTPLAIPLLAARLFERRALLLDEPARDIASVLARLGYVQIDPVNICGRMHDLILRNRVRDYREGELFRHLHGDGRALPVGERLAFEHHMPDRSSILVAFPLDAWPHLLAAQRQRARTASAWQGRLTPREREFAPQILAELAARGPLGSEDLHDGRRGRRVWGSTTLAKSILQKLFFHGRLLIAGRDGNRRLYDLPERVLPASILALPEPSAGDTARWLALLKLRQRRLVLLKRAELPHVADLVQPITLTGLPAGIRAPTLHCLREDLPLLDSALAASSRLGTQNPEPGTPGAATSPPLLLAPLDPLIYDRQLTRVLWNFDYTWEAYTPAHKRVRGHYALPVLAGLELVGHVNPKADRERRKLVVLSRRVRRGHSLVSALRALAGFLGVRA